MAEKNKPSSLSTKLFSLDFDLDTFNFRVGMWISSLISATSTYQTLKTTAAYHHYSLHQYDRPPVVLVTIFVVLAFLAALSFSTPGGYLIDLRRRRGPHWLARGTAWVLECGVLWLYLEGGQLANDYPTMVLAVTMAMFFLCFLRAVAPGFGRNLPIIAVFVATSISFHIGRAWDLLPYSLTVLAAKNLFQSCDERLIIDP